MKIIIDPGHGGKDSGGGSNQSFVEKDLNLKMSLYQYNRLKSLGIEVSLTRDNDIYLSKDIRTQIVRDSKADICISNHINFASIGKANGVETIYSIQNDKTLAEILLNEISSEGIYKRRAFTIRSTKDNNLDYYYMHRETGDVETVIIEYGFASNKEDSEKILNNWKKYAEAAVRGLCKFIGQPYTNVEYTSLLGKSKATILQMKEWAKVKGATEKFINASDIYYKYGELTGIRADILYSQSAKETNFGKYTGVVKEYMNNFAGIKIKNPSGDKTEDHETFNTIDDGIRGHFNHICAYVGLESIGKPHDRYYVVKSLSWSGTLKSVEELSGKWAPDSDYGKSILQNYLEKLLSTKVDYIDYKGLYENAIKENEILNKKIEYLMSKLQMIKKEVSDI